MDIDQEHPDYVAQKAFLKRIDTGELNLAEAQGKTKELFNAELAKVN